MQRTFIYSITGKLLGSDWLKTCYTSYLPPEREHRCLNKSFAINNHRDDVIMVSFLNN